jgi:hypothetical protein
MKAGGASKVAEQHLLASSSHLQSAAGSCQVCLSALSNEFIAAFVGGGGGNRRETRSRKVSQRMAIVDESTRKQVRLQHM